MIGKLRQNFYGESWYFIPLDKDVLFTDLDNQCYWNSSALSGHIMEEDQENFNKEFNQYRLSGGVESYIWEMVE